MIALRAQGHSVTGIAYVLTGRQRRRRKPSDVDGEPSLAAEGSTALKRRSGPQQ